MASTTVAYYTDELAKWKSLINYYNEEIHEFGVKLEEVIHRNSVPNIAAKVEIEQDKLNAISDKLDRILTHIKAQQLSLRTDGSLIDDSLVDSERRKQQDQLRKHMKILEQQYIEVKYGCYNFLLSTLKKY